MTIEENIVKAIETYQMDHAYIMMYFYDNVVMGKVVNKAPLYAVKKDEILQMSEYCFDDELCFQIHIFNRDRELRWHRNREASLDNMEFVCIEDPNRDIELGDMYFEEKMFILGSRGKRIMEKGTDCTLLGQYGREVILPFQVEEENNLDFRLVVHHLFAKDGTICGYRLVDIEGGDL